MLYSANHCIALASLYEEQFGQPVPEDTAKAAARNGMYQQMMRAIDQAIRTHQPISDWGYFAKSLSSNSRQTRSAAGGCPELHSPGCRKSL